MSDAGVPRPDGASPAGAPDIEVIWRDEWLCAIDKPPGLLVHRSAQSRDEVFALQLLRDRIGQRVWPVHRLDRATSGVCLFALDSATAAALGRQLMARTVSKRYLAVVRGFIAERVAIDHPLADQPDAEARSAQTEFRRLAQLELPYAIGRYPSQRYSLVEAWPRTGRRHQIRRHLKHCFHPAIGDTTYGEGRHNRLFREVFGSHRLLLHAERLTFRHPETGRTLELSAPPSGVFQEVIEAFAPVSP